MHEKCTRCQIENAHRIIDKINISNASKENVKKEVSLIAAKYADDDNPLDMTKNIFAYLEKVSDVKEYFRRMKDDTNSVAKEHLNAFKSKIEKSPDLLFEKIKYSILGNIIDYGIPKQGDKDFKKEFENLLSYDFGVNDYSKFLKDLRNAKSLIYLCDNSGEIIFDLYLLEQLKKSYPEIEISLVMRSKDILNDVTTDDIRMLGYKGDLIDGDVLHPGVLLDKVSAELLEKLNACDIVVSKGQGNFEGLFEKALFNIYFLFVAKCEIVADLVGVKKGDLVFLKANKEA